jgi:hypothetical protein
MCGKFEPGDQLSLVNTTRCSAARTVAHSIRVRTGRTSRELLEEAGIENRRLHDGSRHTAGRS